MSAEALQQLKQGQSQLSGSTSKALKALQREQQSLQQQILSQQRQLQALEQQAVLLRRQQHQHGPSQSDSSAADSLSNSSSATPPDPWQASAPGTPTSSSNSNGMHGGLTSRRGDRKHSLPPSNGHMLNSSLPTGDLNGTAPPAAPTTSG